MYPKVKVRDYEEDGLHHHHHHQGHGHDVGTEKHGGIHCHHGRYHVASLKDVQSLFAQASCASPHHSVKNYQEFSVPVVAKVFVPKASTSGTPKKHREIDHCGQPENENCLHVCRNEHNNHDIHQCKDTDDNRQNSQADSIMRPRAVLSSPANDTMIGKKNKTKKRLPLPLRHHDSVKNRHAEAQCRVFIGHVNDECPDSTRENEDSSNRKGDSKTKATGSMSKIKSRNEKPRLGNSCCSSL